MRIAVDARMAHWTGVGRYIRELFAAVSAADAENEYVLAVNPGDDRSWIPAAGNFKCAEFSRTVKPYTVSEQRHLRREMAALKPDVVHFPQFNVPAFSRMKYVVTIHDLIYVFFRGDCPSVVAHIAVKALMRIAVKNAARIVCVSNCTRNDIARTFGTDEGRITVTHLGAKAVSPDAITPEKVEAAKAAAGVSGPYIFYTGNHSPHKNLATLVKALVMLNRSGAGLKAVVTGRADRHTPALLREIARAGAEKDVVLAGFVPDEHLFPLYKGAEALVFPSLYEGFGLPPLEAFACGTPVVASNTSSLPEVLGDGAVLLDPQDDRGFAAAVARIRSDRAFREDLVSRGRRRLSLYTWAETAKRTIGAFKAAASR